MSRRDLIVLLGGAIAWTRGAGAQQTGKVPRIGILHPGRSEPDPGAVQQGLRELGYIEGQNIVIEHVYAEWRTDRFPLLAAELARRKVDVIVVISTSPAQAAKAATSTIPIVVTSMADPVGDGLVASLSRPGGNLTGTTFLGPELIAKRFGLLKEAMPGLLRVAALWHPTAYAESTMARIVKEAEVAAATLGVELQLVPARSSDDFDSAFGAMIGDRAGALIVLPSPMLFTEHRRIVRLAAQSRLPAMYQAREFVDAGGLMSYGANINETNRRGAAYVDKILKGAKPAELPVEQPTKFEFCVNLETARQLGLVMPSSLLASADEVIQ